MSTEVEKYSVFDPRILQTKPKYAVEKGALSLSNVSFTAQTADASSCQFNVQVPSENVFVDRAIEWSATQCATLVVVVTVPVGGWPAGTSLQGLVAPAAFPLHQSVNQMSATINDATVSVNTLDVLPQVLRLADNAPSRLQRTCPTMLDRYGAYPDSTVVGNSPLNVWSESYSRAEVPNGGFNGFFYCTDTSGTPQPISGAGTSIGNVDYINGQPFTAAGLAAGSRTLTFNIGWQSVEKVLLSPFIFADQYELSTGLFGVQNFQVQMNMAANPNRSARCAEKFKGGTITNVTSTWTLATVFKGTPTLAVQFLTPSLDVPLPPKSVVPFMEYPRYIATPQTSISLSTAANFASGAGQPIQSQTITLPNIPDLLLIYVKPGSSTLPSTAGDFTLPITNISLNFDNFSGLLSNATQEQLYQMSVMNGLDMDWSEWSGLGSVPISGTAAAPIGGQVGLCGGPLVLRPGRDFALSTGQAPGLVGNFTLQFNLQVQNFVATCTPNIYTVPISSGFFETIKGSSRIVKGVLTEQDILGAPPSAPSEELARHVGGAMGGRVGGRVGGRMGGRKQSMAAYM